MKKLLLFLALAAAGLQGRADDNFYLLGDATPIGWIGTDESDRTPTKMQPTGNANEYAWTGLLKTANNGFKICKNTSWNGYRATSDQEVLVYDADISTQDNNDYKWKVVETNYCYVTLNTSTSIIRVHKLVPANDEGTCLIGTESHLTEFRKLVNDKGMTSLNAELTADITLTGNHTPIGTSTNKYKGTFDGQGHNIKNLSISSDQSGVGFFGQTNGATIQNVEFLKAKVTITGNSAQNTGIVVGICDGGTISQCAVVNSYINGRDHTGSIAGSTLGGVTISNCYSNAKVTSNYQAGGLVGTMNGNMTLEKCIFMGPCVEATVNDGTAAGLISRLESGTLTLQNNFVAAQYVLTPSAADSPNVVNINLKALLADKDDHSYCNTTFSGGTNNYTLKTTLYGKRSNTYKFSLNNPSDKNGGQKNPSEINQTFFSSTLGFDFTDTWKMVEGLTYAGGSFPILKWMTAPASSVEISTKQELYDFSAFMWDNQNVILTGDIETDSDYTPVGNEVLMYKGTFDGNGKKITLSISSTNKYQGLFGIATGGATLQNLIIDGTVSGGQCSAALVGQIGAESQSGTVTIRRVGCEATVSGDYSYHGAFVGNNYGGVIKLVVENSYNIGNVSGSSNTGVMGGYASTSSTYTNVFNKGTITGGGQLFAYENRGTCTNCYTTMAGTHTGLVTGISSRVITFGELCYKLNSGTSVWKQTIGTDNYPKLFGTSKEVYQVVENSMYSNLTASDGKVEIATASDLEQFANEVNAGNTALCAIQTANIDFSTQSANGVMIGNTSELAYSGTYDGQAHEINVIYTSSANNTALFRHISNAHLTNIITTGSITDASYSCSGGIFAAVENTSDESLVENCMSSVTFNYSGSDVKDKTFGGIGAYMRHNGTIRNCAFFGNFNAAKAKGNGGILGYAHDGSVTVKDCYVNATITVADDNDNNIIVRHTTSTNSYYVTKGNLRTQTGATHVESSDVTSGKLCYLLNGDQSSISWYQNLTGTVDDKPLPFSTHKKVYMYSDTYYTNMEVSDGKIQIGTPDDLKDFSSLVNGGKPALDAELTDDINMIGQTYTPIGNSSNRYRGEFDGNGKTITFNHSNSGYTNQALFGEATDGANIHDIIVAGYFTANERVAGIIGLATGGGTITLENVINKANIDATAGTSTANAAGLVGCATGNTVINATNCANMGKISNSGYPGSGTQQCAAFAGWTQDNGKSDGDKVKTTFTNCWNSGIISNYENKAILYRNTGAVDDNNCYHVTDDDFTPENGTRVGSSTLASGELCYKLGGTWRQTLGTDAHPTFDDSKPNVYEIAVSSAGYASFVPVANIAALPTGVTAYAGQISGNWLHLEPVTELPKDVAVIVKADEGNYYCNSTTEARSLGTTNDLDFSSTDVVSDGTYYCLGKKGSPAVVGFYQVESGVTIPARKVFLVGDIPGVGPGGVKGFTFVFDDTEDGIKTLSNSPLKGENIYNLAGQRVSRMQKGINIVNGKKIMK